MLACRMSRVPDTGAICDSRFDKEDSNGVFREEYGTLGIPIDRLGAVAV